MRKFTLSEKLKKKAAASIPTELEKQGREKEPLLRKWFLRLTLIALVLGAAYFVLRDVFFIEVKGLIKPERVTAKASVDGVFISFASTGDVVEPNKPVGKIYNPEVESEIKALNESLKLLESWREKLEKENLNRKELEKLNQEMAKATRLYSISNPEAIRKDLQSLYKQRTVLIEEITLLKNKLRGIKELISIGAATELDLESVKLKLTKLEIDLASINSKIVKLKDELKRVEELKKILKETRKVVDINPLLSNVAVIDREIESIRSRIKILESKVSAEFISFPFKAKIAFIVASGSYVTRGTQVVTAFNTNKYYVLAYVPPDRVKGIYRGDHVKIILPGGDKIEGVIVGFEPTLVLKPAVLVGPLEKRNLVLPVKIKILKKEREVRKIVYEDMPVTVVFGK